MNLASGNSGTKIHWSRGSLTACNRKMSTNKDETEHFQNVDLHDRCKKCQSVFEKSQFKKA